MFPISLPSNLCTHRFQVVNLTQYGPILRRNLTSQNPVHFSNIRSIRTSPPSLENVYMHNASLYYIIGLIFTSMCIYKYTYVYIFMYIYICIHIYVYIYIHIYIYTYTHMYVYISIYIYMCIIPSPSSLLFFNLFPALTLPPAHGTCAQCP